MSAPRSSAAMRALHRILGIQAEDLSLLGWLGLAAFWLNTASVLAWSSLMGRFVSRVGGEKMPLIYISVNLFAIVLLLGLARKGKASKKGGAGGIWLLVAGASLALVAMGVLPGRKLPPVIFGCFLASWLYLMLFELEFWKWVGQTLPLRLGKRLTPGVGALGTAGRVAGAALATDPLGIGSISKLLIFASLVNALTLPTLWMARRRLGDHPAGATAEPEPESGDEPAPDPLTLSEILGYVRTSSLLMRIAVLCAAVGFFKGTAHYPLTVIARTTFETEQQMAAFFGSLGAGVNLLAVFLQLLGTGQILRRLQLRVSMAFFPAAMALGGLVAAFFPIFPLAALIRFLQRTTTRALHVPACVMMFGPVPARYYAGARNIAYGIAGAVGFLVAGCGMQLFDGGKPPLPVVYAGIGVVGILALMACPGLDRAYLETLVDASADEEDGAAEEEEVGPLLAGAGELADVLLGGGDGELVRLVRDAFAEHGPGDLSEALRAELRRADGGVQVAALERLLVRRWQGGIVEELASSLLGGEDGELVARAARALEETHDSRYSDVAVRTLRSVERGVEAPRVPRLAGAVVALSNRSRDLRFGLRRLRQTLHSPVPEVRVAAVVELGRLGSHVFVEALLEALDDPAPEVVRAAAAALARGRHTAAVTRLSERRDAEQDEGLRRDLSRALTRIHSGTLAQVGSVLDSFGAAERRQLAASLRGVADRGRLALLPRVLAVEDPEARQALVDTMRDEADPALVEAVEASLRESEQGRCRLGSMAPFLELMSDRDWGSEHPVAGLVVRLAGGVCKAEARTWVGDALRGLRAAAPDELEPRLRRVCLVLGGLRRSPGAFLRALDLVAAGSPKTPTALELLETGARSVELKEAIVAAAERVAAARRSHET